MERPAEFFREASGSELIEYLKQDMRDRVAENLSGYWPNPPQRVVALGDIHGDWEALLDVLVLAKLIASKEDLRWTGGSTYVVQCGDILDRFGRIQLPENAPEYMKDDGTGELRALAYLSWLDDQATKEGGRVLGVLGNHEWNNFRGDVSYTTPLTREVFIQGNKGRKRKSQGNIRMGNDARPRLDALTPGGWLALWFSRNRYWMVQIGAWVFVHGGFFGQMMDWKQILQIERVVGQATQATNGLRVFWTELLRRYLAGRLPPTKEENPLAYHILEHLEIGILQNRSVGYSLEQQLPPRPQGQEGDPGEWLEQEQRVRSSMERRCNRTKKALQYFNADKLVVAHTPQSSIHSGCDGAVWRVDIMMSRAFLPSGARKIGFLNITFQGQNNRTGKEEVVMTRRVYPDLPQIRRILNEPAQYRAEPEPYITRQNQVNQVRQAVRRRLFG